jgi:hypothetical protein
MTNAPDVAQDPLVIEAGDPRTTPLRLKKILEKTEPGQRIESPFLGNTAWKAWTRAVSRAVVGNPSLDTPTWLKLVGLNPDAAFQNQAVLLGALGNPQVLDDAFEAIYARDSPKKSGKDTQEWKDFVRFADWLRTEAAPIIRQAAQRCGETPHWRRLSHIAPDFIRAFGTELDPVFLRQAHLAEVKRRTNGYELSFSLLHRSGEMRAFCEHFMRQELPLDMDLWQAAIKDMRELPPAILPVLIVLRHNGIPEEESRLVQTARSASCFVSGHRYDVNTQQAWPLSTEDMEAVTEDLKWYAEHLQIGHRLDPLIALKLCERKDPKRESVVRLVHALLRQEGERNALLYDDRRHLERVLNALAKERWRDPEAEGILRRMLAP